MTEPEFDPAPGRDDPPFVAWLDFHRATLLHKCAGLSEDQLRARSTPPSPLSLLGLVRHMTKVERNWFRRVLGGEEIPHPYSTDESEDADFDEVDAADVARDLAAYDAEVRTCRDRAADHPALDTIGARKRRGVHDVSLRWIYVHMIEEYARHNGHADLIRERIDGTTGD